MSRLFHALAISLIEQTHRSDAPSLPTNILPDQQTTDSESIRPSQAQFYKVTVGVETNPGRLRPSTFRESTLFRVLRSMVTSWCTVISKHVSASTCSAILLTASLYLPVEFASADLNFSLSSTLLAPVFASGPQISNANEGRSFRQLNEDLKGELKAKDFYKAENLARAMLAKWPNEALSYAAMGEVKKAQRIYSESLKCFNQALEKPFSKPGDRCEVLIGRADLIYVRALKWELLTNGSGRLFCK